MSDFKLVSVLGQPVLQVNVDGPVISAGTNSQATGTVSFVNSNGITFGLNTNGNMTASIGGVPSPVNFSAGTTSGDYGAIVFSNANGVTFGLDNGTITASAAGGGGGGATVFSNSNNVSFGLNGSTVTATATFAQSTQPVAASGSNGSSTFATLSFGDSNGLSHYFTNGSLVASYTVPNVPAQTYQPVAVSGSNGSFTASTLSFGNLNGLSFYTSNGSIVGSYTDGGGAGGDGNNVLGINGNATSATATYIFSNGNNVSFGLNAGTVTASASYPAQTVDTNKAGTGFTTTTAAGAVIAGTNDTNGLKLAVPSYLTTAQPVGAYLTTARASNDAVGLNTALTANGVSWTVNSSGLSLNVPAFLTTAAQSNHSHNFATTTTNGSQIVVGTTNSAGATIGVPPFITTYVAQTNQTAASGNIAGVGTTFAGTNVSGSMTLNSNGLNLALSAPTPGGGGAINVSAGTTSGNLQTVVFSNSNGVSFGLNGSTITASAAGGGGGGGIALAAGGNTFSTGTVVLSGDSYITLNTAGDTIQISFVPEIISRFVNEPVITAAPSRITNGSGSVFPFQLFNDLNMSNARFGISNSFATATNTSSAFNNVSISMVLYTRNGSTLSSINSGGTVFTGFWQSNSTASMAGARGLTVDFASSTYLDPGEYWMGVWVSTNVTNTAGTATTSLGASQSMMCGALAATAALGLDPWAAATTNTRGASVGLGLINSGATQATIAFSNITGQTGNNAQAAKLWVDLRNWSIW